MFAAGGALTAGLFVRSRRLRARAARPRTRRLRPMVVGLANSSAHSSWARFRSMLWLGSSASSERPLRDRSLRNFTFHKRYPYGFWQFLETDGWMGPYRLGQEPYYEALRSSSPRQLWLYVLWRARRGASTTCIASTIAPRTTTYPFPYAAQVVYILTVAGHRPCLAATSLVFAFFVPGCLALLH